MSLINKIGDFKICCDCLLELRQEQIVPPLIDGNIKDVAPQCEVDCAVRAVSFLTCCEYGLDPSLFEIAHGLDSPHLEQCSIVDEMTIYSHVIVQEDHK